MNYHEIVLVVNVSCIAILLLMALLLLLATKLRGECGYIAAIIVFTTVPVYLYNMTRSLEWFYIAQFLYPVIHSVNTMLLPLLWLFVRRNFDKDFKFNYKQKMHFIPTIICAVLYYVRIVSLTVPERINFMINENTGDDDWAILFNYVVILVQMVAYFAAIFWYLRKIKRSVGVDYSSAEYFQKRWIPRLMTLMAVLFLIVMIVHIISSTADIWLIPILNVIAMSYLTYQTITNLTYTPQISKINDVKDSTLNKVFALNQEQMTGLCKQVTNYLCESQAYRNPDLSLSMLAVQTGISPKNISRSINGYLNKNFFDLVNEMRVEEAKKELLELGENYTVDSIVNSCGFRSRSTFFATFKKTEGKSPAQWLKSKIR